MVFTRPISHNLGICASSLFAGELVGKRQPCVSSGDGHISRDVALLGSLRFTREPRVGEGQKWGTRKGAI